MLLLFSFLTNSYIFKKSYEGRSSLKYCRFSHNNSARELVAGRRTYFFTSIPYTSDQFSSMHHVTLHGGFNHQAACITQNNIVCLLFYFHLNYRFTVNKKIIYRSLNIIV